MEDINITKVNCVDSWMICIYVEDTLLYPIPLNPYPYEIDVQAIIEVYLRIVSNV